MDLNIWPVQSLKEAIAMITPEQRGAFLLGNFSIIAKIATNWQMRLVYTLVDTGVIVTTHKG
jgi:hypothetical protein